MRNVCFKNKKIYIGIFFSLVFCIALCACGKGDIAVSLYDGDKQFGTAYVSNDKKYNFGKPEKTGYTFLGWYSDPKEGIAYTDTEGSSAGMKWKEGTSTTAYAHWSANKYKIRLDYGDDTVHNDVSEISVTYGENIGNLPVPRKKGSSFKGWFTEINGGVQITDSRGNFFNDTSLFVNSVYPMNNEGTVLYAVWGDKTVTYTFHVGEGLPVESVTYYAGEVIHELPSSLLDNHCFASWCFDSSLSNEIVFPYTIPENSEEYVTLYANFIPGTIDVLKFNTIASTGDKEYEVSYKGNAEKIVIPDSYYNKKVTQIRRIDSPNVKEIILPQTVTKIVNGAFENCLSLQKINIPFGVETIPERCFYGCSSLESINLPLGTKSIKTEAFLGCSRITTMYLYENIETIDAGAFRNMSSLSEFIMNNDNERYMVRNGVLYYKVGNSSYLVQYPAAKLGESYNIEASTVKILDYAFSSSKITSIVLGGKISSIGKGTFENCKNLVNVSINGEAISFSIEEDAFLNCSNLKAIKIELSKVPSLHKTAFNGVSDSFSIYVTSDMQRHYQTSTNWRNISSKIYTLGTIFGNFAVAEVNGGYTIRQYFGTEKEVVIPEILNAQKIVQISENAFSFSNTEKITVSKNITYMGDNAFANCKQLKSIIMEGHPPALGNNVFKNISDDFGIYIKNTSSVLDEYRTDSKWKNFSKNIWSYQ